MSETFPNPKCRYNTNQFGVNDSPKRCKTPQKYPRISKLCRSVEPIGECQVRELFRFSLNRATRFEIEKLVFT